MAKAKTSASDIRSVGKGKDDTPVTSDNASTIDNAGVSNGSRVKGSNLQNAGSKSRTRNRTNPPVYILIGTRQRDNAMDVLATYPTKGKCRIALPQVRQMVGRFYDAILIGKMRYLSETDLAKVPVE